MSSTRYWLRLVIMRRIFFFFLYGSALLFGPYARAADWFDTVADFAIGYRLDSFDWSIDNAPCPSFREIQLNWKDLQILDVMASVKITACDLIYWRMNGNWGSIYLGKNRYRSFVGFDDAPPTLYADLRSSANGTWVFDGSTGIGFHIGGRECGRGCGLGCYGLGWSGGGCAPSLNIQVSPMVGYSVHGQKLTIQDTTEVFGPPPPIGPVCIPLCRTHVTYEAIWDGPWLGADIKIDLCSGFHLIGQGEWHWARYHGDGVWHRDRFCMTYKDTASAHGYVFLAGINYCTTPTWAFGLMGTLQRFQTDRHGNKHVVKRVTSFLLPEEELVEALPLLCHTALRKVVWHSAAIFFTFDTYF